MARPRKKIDKSQFEKLCALQCTEIEIAGFFSCSVDTVERWCDREYGQSFADVFKQKRSAGMISLRRSQFKLAESNAAMGIWLGKQYLGQTDIQERQVSVQVDDRFIEALNSTAESDWKEGDDGAECTV